jgi:hypothetical protein
MVQLTYSPSATQSGRRNARDQPLAGRDGREDQEATQGLGSQGEQPVRGAEEQDTGLGSWDDCLSFEEGLLFAVRKENTRNFTQVEHISTSPKHLFPISLINDQPHPRPFRRHSAFPASF